MVQFHKHLLMFFYSPLGDGGIKFFDILGKQSHKKRVTKKSIVVVKYHCNFKIFKANKGTWWMPWV